MFIRTFVGRLLVLAGLSLVAFAPTAVASADALALRVPLAVPVSGCADSQEACEECCDHAACCCENDGGSTTGNCTYTWVQGQQSTCTLPGCFGGSQTCDPPCVPIF
jgi:hypothetical protein